MKQVTGSARHPDRGCWGDIVKMAINRIKNCDALDVTEPFDVCVIGSGPAGTLVAKTLVENGLRTLMLESGTNLYQWFTNKKIRNLADFEVSGNANYPVHHTRGVLLGGTSNFWTGRCERFHSSDFERHPYTPQENPWPIAYEELDPYYEKAETLFRVRGGERSEFIPPRKKPLPLPSKLDISYLKQQFGNLDIIVDDSPTATPTRDIRFFKIQKEILPSFIDAHNFTLITGVTVTKLLTGPNRKVVGAEVRTFDGTQKIARAKVYVVACGGISSPRLLLLSKSEQFPNGIGNASDWVGRGFNEHPGLNFYAQINHQWETIYPSNKIGRTHQFYSCFREKGLGSILPVFRQSWILLHHNLPFKVSNIPKHMRSFVQRLFKATLYIGIVIEMKVNKENRVMLSENRKDAFGNPMAHLVLNYSDEDLQLIEECRKLAREWYKKMNASNIYEAQIAFSRHHQGTCRMGDNSKTSVVDRDLRVHECSNLYIGGSEVFVTGGAMQPVLSISALSLRLGDHLVNRFSEGAYSYTASIYE